MAWEWVWWVLVGVLSEGFGLFSPRGRGRVPGPLGVGGGGRGRAGGRTGWPGWMEARVSPGRAARRVGAGLVCVGVWVALAAPSPSPTGVAKGRAQAAGANAAAGLARVGDLLAGVRGAFDAAWAGEGGEAGEEGEAGADGAGDAVAVEQGEAHAQVAAVLDVLYPAAVELTGRDVREVSAEACRDEMGMDVCTGRVAGDGLDEFCQWGNNALGCMASCGYCEGGGGVERRRAGDPIGQREKRDLLLRRKQAGGKAAGVEALAAAGGAGMGADVRGRTLSWDGGRVFETPGFVSPEEAAGLVALAEAAGMMSGAGAAPGEEGTAGALGHVSEWMFTGRVSRRVVGAAEDARAQALVGRAARWARVAPSHAEGVAVLQFGEGEAYRLHPDTLGSTELAGEAREHTGKQRAASVYVFLSDGGEGGGGALWLPKAKPLIGGAGARLPEDFRELATAGGVEGAEPRRSGGGGDGGGGGARTGDGDADGAGAEGRQVQCAGEWVDPKKGVFVEAEAGKAVLVYHADLHGTLVDVQVAHCGPSAGSRWDAWVAVIHLRSEPYLELYARPERGAGALARGGA